MNQLQGLEALQRVLIHQKFEVAEFFGFETRNKYQILGEDGSVLGFAAEQQKGLVGFLLRQLIGLLFRRESDVTLFRSDCVV